MAGREFMLPSDFKLSSRQRQAADNILGFIIVDTDLNAQFKARRGPVLNSSNGVISKLARALHFSVLAPTF